ncbi:uncharacterized protein V6R79_017010 [Siganus canaliculatus]
MSGKFELHETQRAGLHTSDQQMKPCSLHPADYWDLQASADEALGRGKVQKLWQQMQTVTSRNNLLTKKRLCTF